MPWFLTEYEPWPVKALNAKSPIGKYASHVWARDWNHAEALCKMRRIGERVTGRSARRAHPMPYRLPSELIKPRMTPAQKIEFLHATCFLAFLIARYCSHGWRNRMIDYGEIPADSASWQLVRETVAGRPTPGGNQR